MNIKQASIETAISKDMIRFYEKKGIIHPKRKENGYRDYSTQDLHLLILIKQYNALGIPLSTIQSMLKDNDISVGKQQLNNHISQLKQDVEYSYARYHNALDLKVLLENYQNNILYETGIRQDLYYIPITPNFEYINLVNSGIARPVYHIQSEYLKQQTYPSDYGLLLITKNMKEDVKFTTIPKHKYYRVIAEVPSNHIISTSTLNSLIHQMHLNGYQECGDIFIYQFIMNSNSNMDTICVEFTIK